ncbi:MAG: AAA family ATPase [Sphaerospermopsis sp. SIO1G2]|nr:AAA family ATPase [Sphaerospermopsis sp. SIO1G2]
MTVDGYAGTGKTTLANHIAANSGRTVHFAAFTGKAASVLRSKGCDNATTIHKLIYTVKDKPETHLNKLRRDLANTPEHYPDIREEIERCIAHEVKRLKQPSFDKNEGSSLRKNDLVIIDERYMMNQQMGEDLTSFGCKVLLLGDPGQLPPVGGKSFLSKKTPDVLLTEIHRQARDNPIIDMATRIRSGENLPVGAYGNSSVVAAGTKMDPEQVLGYDQLIVGKNITRKNINARVRALHSFEGVEPVKGERLVCLRNDHDLGLMNGQIWKTIADSREVDEDCVRLDVVDEFSTDTEMGLLSHRCFFHGYDYRQWCEEQDKSYSRFAEIDSQSFDYGYALTCHKSQGSQWDNVLVFNESRSFGQDHRKWLYTAVTRAANAVCIKEMI